MVSPGSLIGNPPPRWGAPGDTWPEMASAGLDPSSQGPITGRQGGAHDVGKGKRGKRVQRE